jgi:hypothetical protein
MNYPPEVIAPDPIRASPVFFCSGAMTPVAVLRSKCLPRARKSPLPKISRLDKTSIRVFLETRGGGWGLRTMAAGEQDMGELVPYFDPSNYKIVGQRIRRIADNGDLQILPHAQQRMRERKLETIDILYLLRHGVVVNHTRAKGAWRWKINGTTVDRRRATCIVEIDGSLIVVTVI